MRNSRSKKEGKIKGQSQWEGPHGGGQLGSSITRKQEKKREKSLRFRKDRNLPKQVKPLWNQTRPSQGNLSNDLGEEEMEKKRNQESAGQDLVPATFQESGSFTSFRDQRHKRERGP